MSQTSKKRLEAFEMWALRRLLRISWTERMSNDRVLTLAGVRRELIQLIQKQKLRYFGHLIRHDSLQRVCWREWWKERKEEDVLEHIGVKM